MYQLGGHALFISAKDSQIGRGEPTQDTARVMSRMLDGIMIRTFEQKEVEMLAEYGSIPIINGLTDLVTLSGYGRPADHSRTQGQAGRTDHVLYRRRQQHGKLPLIVEGSENRHERTDCLP